MQPARLDRAAQRRLRAERAVRWPTISSSVRGRTRAASGACAPGAGPSSNSRACSPDIASDPTPAARRPRWRVGRRPSSGRPRRCRIAAQCAAAPDALARERRLRPPRARARRGHDDQPRAALMDSPAEPLTGEAVELLRVADPLRHRQPARQRARGAGAPRGRARRPRASTCELLGRTPERPNLVARLDGARARDRCCACSRTSTRCSRRRRSGAHDPWSGDLEDGFVWGRGALDMKSQTAAEVVAACSLARAGLAARARRAAGRRARRRGDRRRRGSALADRDPPREGPLRLPAQRGRRAASSSTSGRRVYCARLRREGRLPLRRAHRRRGRPRRRCRGSATTRC